MEEQQNNYPIGIPPEKPDDAMNDELRDLLEMLEQDETSDEFWLQRDIMEQTVVIYDEKGKT